MKIALLSALITLSFSCSQAVAEMAITKIKENPIRVADITYTESLNKEREIGLDIINVVQDLTLLSFNRNNIQYHSGGAPEIKECINSTVDRIDVGSDTDFDEVFDLIFGSCAFPVQFEWSFNFLFSDNNYEVYQIYLKLKETVSLRRDFPIQDERNDLKKPNAPIYPYYATVWSRSYLTFCPVDFHLWSTCNNDIITVTRKLLADFDKTNQKAWNQIR